MRFQSIIFSFLFFCCNALQAQTAPDPIPVQKQKARQAIKDMRDSGVLVVRLKTELRAIQVYQAILNRTTLGEKQRVRHEKLLAAVIRERDDINNALIHSFIDSFKFCPVYFAYDTSARNLYKGTRQGIFWEWKEGVLVKSSVQLAKNHVFTAYLREASGEYPYDAIVIQRVEEELPPPFPYDAPVRSSFISESKNVQIRRAADGFDNRLRKFYARVASGAE